MNIAELNDLEHFYDAMTRRELLDCLTDLIGMAREQAASGNPEGIKALARAAATIAGSDALEAARDVFRA